MIGTEQVLAALRQRLRAAAQVLLDDLPAGYADPGLDATVLLDALVDRARATPRRDEAWLLWVAVAGYLPLDEDVVDLVRGLELAPSTSDAEIWLLQRAKSVMAENDPVARTMTVLTDAVVVDVSFSAQFDKHTGIQRVTREVCPRWHRSHDVTFVAWTPEQRALRRLTESETALVLAWGDDKRGSAPTDPAPSDAPVEPPGHEEDELVVPWRSTLVLPEVAQGVSARPLAALAQHSGNRVVAIGYDAIPAVSADLRPLSEPDQFVGYLTVIKHAHRVAGISASATAEFRGFAEAVRAQGLPGPDVAEVLLTADVPEGDAPQAVPPRPLVLCVGSHELHKNHLAVLHAAELLWREGLTFDLTFVGGPGWDASEYESTVAGLRAAGRPVTTLGSVTDDELWSLYRRATFSVFPSLHEGYGLPVAESLACGTPVITSEYGSTEEIAREGGCLLVDPRDDLAIRDAIRRLLCEPELLAELRRQAPAARRKTWDEYADQAWDALVGSRS